MKFLSEFDSFLMYIDNHTISQNFLKISMFSNKKFTFSSSAQLFEKVNISHKISIFFSQNWHFCTKLMLRKTLVTLLQRLHDMIFSLGGKVFHLLENCYFDSKISFYWYFGQKCHFPSKIYISGGINSLEKSSNFFEKGVNLDVNLENNDNWFQK